MAIRDEIGKHLPLPPNPVPGNNTKKAYGNIQLAFVSFIQMRRYKTAHLAVTETVISELHQS